MMLAELDGDCVIGGHVHAHHLDLDGHWWRAIVAAYLAQTFFNLSNTQIAIAWGIVALTALSYQVNTLREEKPKLKKKFVNNLLFSDPIAVKHNPAKTLTPDGKEHYGAGQHDFESFVLFWHFGEAVNSWLKDSNFRIQEINSTEISGDLASDGPAYGRRYEIFYNQEKVGLLQIMASHRQHFDKQDKSVYAHIALDLVPVTAIAYQPVSGFLHTIASLVTSTKRNLHGGDRTEYEEAKRAINNKLAEMMWNTLRDYMLGDPPWPELEVSLEGTPDRYYHEAAHERGMREMGGQGSDGRSA